MKKKFTITAVLMMAFLIGTVSAQEKKGPKKVRIGLGLEAALPTGNFGKAYTVGGGLTLRAAVAVNEKMAVTGTSGIMAFVPKDISGVDLKAQLNIPIKAGFRYMLTEKVYGLGEAGTTIAKVYYPDSSGNLQSVSSSSFTYAANIGTYLGAFDASLRYEGYTGSGFVGLRLGFNF